MQESEFSTFQKIEFFSAPLLTKNSKFSKLTIDRQQRRCESSGGRIHCAFFLLVKSGEKERGGADE